MLPLGQEGISSCLEKSISILLTRNALQMGIFPIPQSIPFVPILIPISSHSPVSCPLELVSTCCSFIIQETGCFTSHTFLQEGICVSKPFCKGLKSKIVESCVPWQPCHRQGPRMQASEAETQHFCFVQTMETGCFCPCTEEKKHSSNNKCHNLKSCHKTEMSSSGQVLETFSLGIYLSI